MSQYIIVIIIIIINYYSKSSSVRWSCYCCLRWFQWWCSLSHHFWSFNSCLWFGKSRQFSSFDKFFILLIELFNASWQQINIIESLFMEDLWIVSSTSFVVHVHYYDLIWVVLVSEQLSKCFISSDIRSREVNRLFDVPFLIVFFFSHIQKNELSLRSDSQHLGGACHSWWHWLRSHTHHWTSCGSSIPVLFIVNYFRCWLHQSKHRFLTVYLR